MSAVWQVSCVAQRFLQEFCPWFVAIAASLNKCCCFFFFFKKRGDSKVIPGLYRYPAATLFLLSSYKIEDSEFTPWNIFSHPQSVQSPEMTPAYWGGATHRIYPPPQRAFCFLSSSKNDKSQPRGTFELLRPIGSPVTELWSFPLSSDIDLPLRQLVWPAPFFPLLILFFFFFFLFPLQSKALRKYSRTAWSQRKPNCFTFLPFILITCQLQGLGKLSTAETTQSPKACNPATQTRKIENNKTDTWIDSFVLLSIKVGGLEF